MGSRWADFLGIGVQKGGTTTLQKLLEQHPAVYLPARKELHYFSLHYALGSAWYAAQFSAASPDQICGDITPYYVFHPEVADRIHRLIPQVRLVVLLRDPVERCLSHYFHACRLGFENLNLPQALAAESERLAGAGPFLAPADGHHFSYQEHSYLARSRYEQQLLAYEQRFNGEQMLVLRSEDLFDDPARIWDQLLSFLELEAVPLPPGLAPANVGRGEAAGVEPQWRDWLREQLQPTYRWAQSQHGLSWN